jgi:hypothetical protein
VEPHGRSDRYEPLPGLLQIPGFLLRKLGARGRRVAAIAGALVIAGLAVGVLVGIPALQDAKRRSAAADARADAAYRAGRLAELRREVRPISGRGPASRGLTAPATVGPQRALRAGLLTAIVADGARRARTGEFARPPKRAECEPSPGTPGTPDPASRAGARTVRYFCLAVTTDVAATGASNAGSIGYPYSALVDFPAGRFAFCKVSGRPGEMLIGRDIHVPVPAACGGR